ncbi:MAG: hypothetical protein KAT04_13025 [Methylococcales bacterium]|nr:hypothetical protein [Methylococcales bacterium]
MAFVRCGDCAHFLPDEVGDGTGIGNCFRFEEYKLKNPSEAALVKARASMGKGLLYPSVERDCSKFGGKNEKS